MTGTSRYLTVGLIVTVGLAGLGRKASADQTELPEVDLWIRDTAGVPDDVLTRAQAEVTRIYREAGVDAVWRAPSPSSATTAARKPPLTVAILSRDQEKRLGPALPSGGVGVALGSPTTRARLAYVFYHRVETLTGSSGFDRAQVLGIAMAHEIGHMLLPHNTHSTGLMRADWTNADLQLAQRGRLFFTAEQGELIRTRIAGSPP